MKIINLTGAKTTPEQADLGVVDLPANKANFVQHLLNPIEPPSSGEIGSRARGIAAVMLSYDKATTGALIGGQPAYINAMLEDALVVAGYRTFYMLDSTTLLEI
jgi:hypothetical protein